MAAILQIIFQIIRHTPFWVWIVLFILIKRGRALMTESPVSVGRSCLMPAIFIIWGLNTIVDRFQSPNVLLSFYIGALVPGFLFSYYLYKNRRFHVNHDGLLIQEGSRLPIIIMLSNFLVKYLLNVILATQPGLYANLPFNIFYGCICGFTIGLFFGGIFKSMQAKRQLAL
ncbi:MAG: DUF6622 family protein [Oenococcus sp.]|uniref:DUF6622 family protein n=1 Tax=Oenococcus sp. TaxID=1979414 RepID=UPI0039EA1C4F